MKKAAGFTLIEIMIAVAIMGILAMVAYPSYQNSVRKSRRADGIAAALAVQVAQERFRGSCKFYAENLGGADVCGATASASTVAANATSNDGFYTLSITASSASGNSWTLVVAPTGNQTADTTCSPMRLTFSATYPQGQKLPAECW